jgi:CheY-like chemotaxis protein
MDKKLMLVVDDEQGIRDIIKEYLLPEDFEVIEEKMNQYYLRLFLAIPAEKHGQILESLQLLLKARQETECC